MAEQLVATMTAAFDPEAYHDEYREALLGIIEAKVAGTEITPAAEQPPAALGDLMAALEASVAAAKAARVSDEAAPEQMAGAVRKTSRKPVPVGPGRKPAAVASLAEAESEAEPVLARRRKSA